MENSRAGLQLRSTCVPGMGMAAGACPRAATGVGAARR